MSLRIPVAPVYVLLLSAPYLGYASNDELVRGVRSCAFGQTSSSTQSGPASLSSISTTFGFVSLHHSTHFENVGEILQSGRMELPRNLPAEKIRSFNYTPDLIMFYLKKVVAPPEEGSYHKGMLNAGFAYPQLFSRGSVFTDLNQVFLQFSVEAMNGRDFHIHKKAQAYGAFNKGIDFRSTIDKPKLQDFYSEGDIGEVGFYEEIPTKFLKEVWVSPVRRLELIEKLSSLGITSIGGRPLEEAVRSPPVTHKYTRVRDLDSKVGQHLKPELSKTYEWLIEPLEESISK
jgi:hypothetical protein